MKYDNWTIKLAYFTSAYSCLIEYLKLLRAYGGAVETQFLIYLNLNKPFLRFSVYFLNLFELCRDYGEVFVAGPTTV